MKFILSEITRTNRRGMWVEESKAFAVRSGHEIKDCYHNMKLGETRELANDMEITRTE